MRAGISTPIVANSGKRPAWERSAGPSELIRVAREADRLGFDFMTCPDHVAVPAHLERGERFYDPLATFSYLAAVTTRIRFLPYVLVLPFYHPLEIVKRFGALDHLSGGRLILGLGVGNLPSEFAVLDRPYEGRGERADDALRALRASLSSREVSYQGSHYAYTDMIIEPHAIQERVPLWIGGHSSRALRRASTLGDGWCPHPAAFGGPTPDQVKALLAGIDRPPSFDVVLTTPRPLDPLDEPRVAEDQVRTLQECGVTLLNLTLVHHSLDHYCEQLAAFAALGMTQNVVT